MLHLLLPPAIFLLDNEVKNHIEKTKKEDCHEPMLKQTVIIKKYHNTGACLNFMEQRPLIVTIISVILTLVTGVAYGNSIIKKSAKPIQWGLALMLGGALSNTYDRLERHYVVDYFSLNCKWKGLRQIVFNISDFCIIIGGIMVGIFTDKRGK